ncbi:MAG: EAL domain-containing protein [Acidimicrobiales bacterium]|jgi:diguanylate cyclase (GGDEF)-like protein/PAS domain S-box-containing protein
MPDPHRASPAIAPDGQVARLLDELPDVVIVLDAVGRVLWGNSRAERFFGHTLDEYAGRSGLEFVHPDDLELVLRSLASIQAKEVGTTLEVRLQSTSGWRLIELIGTPVGWFAAGAVLFCLRDLTERRRFEVARDETARFRSLVHNAAAITMLVSPRGHIDSVSAALTRMLGHDPEHVENLPLADLASEPDRPALAAALAEAAQGATAVHPVVVVVRLRRRDGEDLPFELSIVNLVDEPTVGGFVVTAHDISARIAMEVELRATLSLLKATLESTADGVLVVDHAGTITGVNGRLGEMFQAPEGFLDHKVDRPMDDKSIAFLLEQLVNPEAFLSVTEFLSANPEHETTDILEFKDGRVFERFSRPQLVDGEIVGRVWSFRDSTERVRLESELSYQAFHDSLTGLANKALFSDRLNLAVARMERTRKPMAVMFLDLDNFKTVNDSLGHSVGDQLLGAVAEVILGCIRSTDTAARLGGDEFAVLIDYLEAHSDIVALAERILTALRRPVTLGTTEVVATASIGITFGVPGTTGEQLLRNADLAMYRAKEHGKDRFEEFRDHMHTAIVERLELEADLRRTMGGNQELVVHYQPVVDLTTGAIIGFEALVRWQHPLRGLLAPGSFIPFAEEVGLIDVVDRFVLAEACSQLHYWQQRGLVAPDTEISVNLSARELTDPGTATHVAEMLAGSDFDPSNLILEITESAMMHDTETVVQNLHALRALGLRIAVDDFGTGYSSLAYLEQFPVDILKIDRSFVTALSDDDPAGLTRAVIQIAETLGLMTVAEGVESAEQAERLRALGCRAAQGYHLGMPLDAHATEEMLRTRVP